MIHNIPQFPVTWLALSRLGAVMVPVNISYTGRELDYIVNDGDAEFLADRGERQKALQKIANYVADHALELPLYNLDTYYGVNKRVKGLVVPPDNRFRLMGVSVD